MISIGTPAWICIEAGARAHPAEQQGRQQDPDRVRAAEQGDRDGLEADGRAEHGRVM